MMDSFLPLLDDFSMTSRNSSGSNCNDLLFRLSQECYIVKLRAKSTSRSSSDKRDIKEPLSYNKIPGLTYLLGDSVVREVMEVTDRATLLANIFLLAFLHLWPLGRTGSDM